jgi:hypothetical protein
MTQPSPRTAPARAVRRAPALDQVRNLMSRYRRHDARAMRTPSTPIRKPAPRQGRGGAPA